MNRKNPLTRLFALVMAAVLAVGLVPSSAWASKLDYKTVTLQIAIDKDDDGANDLVVNKTFRYVGEKKVSDLFEAAKTAGYILDYGFGGDYLNSVTVTNGLGGTNESDSSRYWCGYVDGAMDGTGASIKYESALVDGSVLQFGYEGYPDGPTEVDWTKTEKASVSDYLIGELTTGVTLQIAYDVNGDGKIDSDELVVNKVYGFVDGATLGDLFAAAKAAGDINGYVFDDSGNGDAYLTSVTLKDGTTINNGPSYSYYWSSHKDGSYGSGSACTESGKLSDGVAFQFAYIDLAGTLSVDWTKVEAPELSDAVAGENADTKPDTDPDADPDTVTVNKYDADKAELLIVNLSGRFRKGGANDAISNSTFEAAVALNQQGLGSSLNAEAILANLEKDLKGTDTYDSMSAGRYAKYILALTSAGVDCTNLTFSDGSVHNAIDEMNKLYDEGTPNVYEAVCILPVYQNYADNGGREAKLIDTIIAAQNEDGLFGATFGSEEYYDSQTTAQAILALIPYKNSNTKAKDAINKAVDAIYTLQNEDGGFAYSKDGGASNLDATAEIVTALSALGFDCAYGQDLTTANGSTPLGWLINQADDTLDAYEDKCNYDETMTSATALHGFVAAAKYNAQPYKLNKVENGSEQKTDGDAQKANDNTQKAGDSTKKSSTTKGNVPSTGDETVAADVVAVLGAAGAFVVFESRRRNAA